MKVFDFAYSRVLKFRVDKPSICLFHSLCRELNGSFLAGNPDLRLVNLLELIL